MSIFVLVSVGACAHVCAVVGVSVCVCVCMCVYWFTVADCFLQFSLKEVS
jgi:hypothetical protein